MSTVHNIAYPFNYDQGNPITTKKKEKRKDTFDAAASALKSSGVSLDGRGSSQLILEEVRVVRRRDKVVAQRSRHVLVDRQLHRVKDIAFLRQQKAGHPFLKKIENKFKGNVVGSNTH